METSITLRASGWLLLVALCAAILGMTQGAQGAPRGGVQAQSGKFKTFLPFTTRPGTAKPPSTPPVGSLPAKLAGTWFTGTIPPTDFYDPTTGEWRDTNGLGQMYAFGANGTFTYAGFLRIQNGQCRSEVSTYQQGSAKASGAQLTLTATIAKTRTVVVCGSRSESTTEGPFEPQVFGWNVVYPETGAVQLELTRGQSTTSFYKKGMDERLTGAWQRGGVSSAGFYDPATEQFAPQTDEGAWFRFNADGTYSFGEFGYGQDNNGCRLAGWVYQEGTVSVSGGQLTTTPKTGVARVDNECTGTQQDAYVEAARSYAWMFRTYSTDPRLVLMPLERFEEIEFVRE